MQDFHQIWIQEIAEEELNSISWCFGKLYHLSSVDVNYDALIHSLYKKTSGIFSLFWRSS